MVKKTLLPALCIATYISTYAMNHNQQSQLSSQAHKQLHYNYKQWQKVTQTSEFILCAELLKQHPNTASSEYNKALNALHATKEFEKYKKYTSTLQATG